jgi:CRISPR-associated protein Cmr6
MPTAAFPSRPGVDLAGCSPGLRFGFLLPIWTPGSWSKVKAGDREALSHVVRLSPGDKELMQQALLRQRALANILPAEELAVFDALSVSPFSTGLGLEHPLENGFAFLSPYGLPYLPGSSVKGVLRKALRDLAGEEDGWDETAIVALFGSEPADRDTSDDALQRGALAFWDVMPDIAGGALAVDIMTPHQAHYYQGKKKVNETAKQSPHESGEPTPIHFLTVPPDSGFAFHVRCDLAVLARTAPALCEQGRWQALLDKAFRHAFDWLGFGAKTAVGYGAMRFDEKAAARREQEAAKRREREEEERRRQAKLREIADRRVAMSPIERAIDERLELNIDKGMKEYVFLIRLVDDGEWAGSDKVAVAEAIKRYMDTRGNWQPKPKGSNKDKDHQRTLKVMKWLRGE